MRVRLRPKHTPERLREIYAVPHDARGPAIVGDDHALRIDATKQLIDDIGPVETAADLSCGNGELLDYVKAETKLYGDFAYDPRYTIQGPIETTTYKIPDVDLFLCCETLEHVDSPEHVLTEISKKARNLILSTPEEESVDSENEEHYWSWGIEDIQNLLEATGWRPIKVVRTVPVFGYTFQIWWAN